MSLSVANTIAWDFTRASTPLASQIGQSETFTLLNGAGVNTTDGITLLTAQDRADLVCSNGGYLVGWTYPYTIVAVFICPRVGTNSVIPMGLRVTSASSSLLGNRVNGSGGSINIVNAGTGLNPTATAPNGSTCLLITEFRAAGNQVWFGATSQWSNSGSYAMPALNTTDIVRIGAGDGNTPGCTVQGLALIPGALTSGDRTALAADWRDALFGVPAGPTPAQIAYYRRHCGLTHHGAGA